MPALKLTELLLFAEELWSVNYCPICYKTCDFQNIKKEELVVLIIVNTRLQEGFGEGWQIILYNYSLILTGWVKGQSTKEQHNCSRFPRNLKPGPADALCGQRWISCHAWFSLSCQILRLQTVEKKIQTLDTFQLWHSKIQVKIGKGWRGSCRPNWVETPGDNRWQRPSRGPHGPVGPQSCSRTTVGQLLNLGLKIRKGAGSSNRWRW